MDIKLFVVFIVLVTSHVYVSGSRRRCSGVHYPRLGCFTLEPPFTNTHWLPQRPSFVNTAFYLYTRSNPTEAQRLYPHQRASIENSYFNRSNPTKVIIHGFMQYGRSPFVVNMTEALLQKSDMNVIAVGWEGGAGFPYTQAVANTRVVGAETALLLDILKRWKHANMHDAHIIGHSLGAHIAGYAGARTPGLWRITGLDPAQPNYSGFPNEVRLDAGDAQFVDVIHTDGVAYNTVQGYGMIEPTGTVDFYPNAGHDQPGCREESSIVGLLEDALSYGISIAEGGVSCSHERSVELFISSIRLSTNPDPRSCVFTAVPCPSFESFMAGECLHCNNDLCPFMGIDADRTRSTGVHFLNTTGTPNFCGYPYFVNLVTSDTSMTDVSGRIEVKVVGDRGSTEWTDVYNGLISPGSRLSHMILSTTDIGDPTEVKIRTHYSHSYFSWSANQAVLGRVEVSSVKKFLTRYFCQDSMTMVEGQELSLNAPHFEVADCDLTL